MKPLIKRLNVPFIATIAVACLAPYVLAGISRSYAIDKNLSVKSFAAVEKMIEPEAIPGTAVLVRDLITGRTLYQLNSSLPLKPASVLKLATTNAALTRLGADFAWQTQISLHDFSRGEARIVSVRGSGDPAMTSETLWLLARRIYKAGVRSIGSLVLDDSAFIDRRVRSGSRAYEGGSSALAFNFNSIGFDVCPGTLGKHAFVTADPWELPLEISGEVKTVVRQGEPVLIEDRSSCDEKGCRIAFELGGTIEHDSTCVVTYRSIDDPREYFGKVLVGLLKQLGIKGEMKLRFQTAPADSTTSIPHVSRPLRDVLVGLNNFSTNVTAEQLVYAIGRSEDGLLMSYRQGLERIRESLLDLDVSPEQVNVVDGSGLSHDNRLSAAAILKILEKQYKNQDFGVEFQSSLSVWGRSGTLKKRQPLPENVYIRGKTGSLDGVSSLAGYLFRQGRHPLAIAVLQNRVASKAKAVDIEDSLVDVISHSDLD